MVRDWEYQNRDPDYERTTPDGDVVVGVVTDFVRVFCQSNPILFGFGYGGSFFLDVLPQNPGFDIQGITNAVNDTLSKQACIDFYKRIPNAASSKDNPLPRGGDLQQIFKDFLAQKNGGFTRTAPPGSANICRYELQLRYRCAVSGVGYYLIRSSVLGAVLMKLNGAGNKEPVALLLTGCRAGFTRPTAV